MNRRSFFKSLSLFAAGLAVAPLAVPKAANGPIPPLKYFKSVRQVAINPEWRDASHEIGFFVLPGMEIIQDPYPFRFRSEADAQAFMSHLTQPLKESPGRCLLGKIIPKEKILLSNEPPMC
jgi:hypothetical protein